MDLITLILPNFLMLLLVPIYMIAMYWHFLIGSLCIIALNGLRKEMLEEKGASVLNILLVVGVSYTFGKEVLDFVTLWIEYV